LIVAAADENIYVVQFIHPGSEHNPGKANRMAWRVTNPHARKFLRRPGRYLDGNREEREADLVFWGEWEGPSDVVERWDHDDYLPRFLHEPIWGPPPTPGFRQNTDPWVFGDTFRYSNCKQLTYRGNPTALQRLTPGSVVLFGSHLGGEFVLDTVFVVGDAEPDPYVPSDNGDLDVDDAFRVCTLNSVATTDGADALFTLFRGATPGRPVNGMYSFVPCRRADAPYPRFKRPALASSRYVNPTIKQGMKGTGNPISLAGATKSWEQVRDQVLDAGCLLGVAFATPPWQPSAPASGSNRRSC
jgi:hypothetical protein